MLGWERLWPALFPSAVLLGALLCAALLGLPALMPPVAQVVVLAAAFCAIVALAWRGLRSLTLPDTADADRRLERHSGHRHRPLATLADMPAPGSGDPTLWQAHVARAAAQVSRLRVGWPHPGLAARDRRALRALVLIGLCASVVIAGPDAAARLRRALLPGLAPAPPPLPTLVQAWLTPPGYTGLAPILLTAAQTDVTAPAGSRLTASISGGRPHAAGPTVSLGQTNLPVQALDAGSWQANAELVTGGTLAIRRGGADLGHWELTAVADPPPDIQWNGTPGGSGSRIPLLRLPWSVAHPYGVAELQAELVLRDRPTAPKILVEVPLPSEAPHQAHGLRRVDLTASPWAGLPVIATLVGRDTGGLAGRSVPRSLVMPARRFQHPAARAIVAVRQMLAVHPEAHGEAVAALTRLMQQDALWTDDSAGLLNLGAVAALLAASPGDRGPDGGVVDEAQDRLWMLALHLEEGLPARTAEALAKARRALHAALDRARHPQPGDKPAELARKLAEMQHALEQALQKHLQALQLQARRDPQHVAPSAAQLQALNKAMQALQQAEQSGDMAQAQQRMAELDEALAEMERERRQAELTPQQRQRAEQRQRGRQQMSVVRDLVQREGGILDHAQARATPPDQIPNSLDFPPGEQLQSQPDPGRVTRAQDDRAAQLHDAVVQRALRRAVGVLMQAQADLTGSVPPPLDQAERAMHDAQQALSSAQDDTAAEAARKAIEALQKSGQAMGQAMAQMFGRQPGEGEDQGEAGQDAQDGQGDGFGDAPGDSFSQDDTAPGRGSGDAHTDPFGRADREGVAGGVDDGGETAVPETREQARTKAVQDELRRRAAERTRPQTELDYIGRLLDAP